MMYKISARRTNDPAPADGYGEWDEVGEWEADTAEDALFYWMEQQPYCDSRFAKTGENSYRLNDMKFDCKAEPDNR